MKNNNEAFANDLTFVLEECARIQLNLQQHGLTAIPEEEHWYTLPHPSGVGELLCGRAAAEKISNFAVEASRRGNLAKRIQLSKIRTEISILFVSRFIKEKRQPSVKEFDRMIGSVVRRVEQTCVTLTHLIPCHLMSAKDPATLAIGPVTFHNRASGQKLLLGGSRGSRKLLDGDDAEFHRTLLARAFHYYRNFQWVAEVQITKCDPKTSEVLAEDAVTCALNCLHLLLSGRNSQSMQIGGPNLRTNEKAKLVITEAGEMQASLSRGGFGEVHFPEEWSAMLAGDDYDHWHALFSTTLDSIVDPSLERPMARRFLDSAQWFGEAARDTNSATRIIKYVTALERMFMTEEHQDISALVAERVAAVCFSASETTREVWRKKVKTSYDLRSKLVHGSISQSSPEVYRGVALAAEIAEAALLRGIEAFGIAGLQREKMTSKSLAIWFDRVIQWADTVEAAHAAAIGS